MVRRGRWTNEDILRDGASRGRGLRRGEVLCLRRGQVFGELLINLHSSRTVCKPYVYLPEYSNAEATGILHSACACEK